jgi:hypothetical protein
MLIPLWSGLSAGYLSVVPLYLIQGSRCRESLGPWSVAIFLFFRNMCTQTRHIRGRVLGRAEAAHGGKPFNSNTYRQHLAATTLQRPRSDYSRSSEPETKPKEAKVEPMFSGGYQNLQLSKFNHIARSVASRPASASSLQHLIRLFLFFCLTSPFPTPNPPDAVEPRNPSPPCHPPSVHPPFVASAVCLFFF